MFDFSPHATQIMSSFGVNGLYVTGFNLLVGQLNRTLSYFCILE